MKGVLKTSVVLPPDSEIVVPFSVRSPSGVRLGSCSLVEPSRSLTEEYGVVVGHTGGCFFVVGQCLDGKS